MKGIAPKSPLTGSQFFPLKNAKPNFTIVICDRTTSVVAMRMTMAKMLSAQIWTSTANDMSAALPLPRLPRKSRIGEGDEGPSTTGAAAAATKFVTARCVI